MTNNSPLADILMPTDLQIKEKYLELGWFEKKSTAFAPAYLSWNRDRGAPIHPSEGIIAAVSGQRIDDLLGWRLMNQVVSRLPDAKNNEGEYLEVKVEVAVCFKRKSVKGARKLSQTLQSWDICSARVEMPSES